MSSEEGRCSWQALVWFPFCLALVLGVGGFPLEGQGAVYRVRGVAGLSAEARVDLAERGAPLWELVKDEKTSVGDVVRSLCGEQPATVGEYLTSRAVALNRVPSADELVPEGSIVAVPFCLKIEERKAVTVAPGDTVEGLLKVHYGVYGPQTVRRVFELNAKRYSGMSLQAFTTHLRPGSELLLPYTSEERTLFWADPDAAATPVELVRGWVDPVAGDAFASTSVPLEITTSPYWFQSVPFVEAEGMPGAAGCTGADYSERVGELVERYRVESGLVPQEQRPQSTIIGIVDTGLSPTDRFFDGILLPNPSENSGNPREDDDDPRNDYEDDVFGISLEARNGNIFASVTDNPRGHGTKVATLVAAGPDFETWRPAVTASPFGIKFVSYSSNLPRSGVDPSILSNAPPYLAKQGAQIVNMSLSNQYQPVPLTEVLASTPEILYVVAAGNTRVGGGRQLGPHTIYPALYGGRIGRFSHQVLTVGAHDGEGRLAPFSNYSRELVDLLAPGCAVKTRDESGESVLEHGTSLATAIVSFAASLIHSLGLDGPAQIKNRILVATDFDASLESYAWSSGRLNLVKAISLRHDIVETTAGLQFGRVEPIGAVLDLCEEHPGVSMAEVRKVVPNIRRGDVIGVEIWTESYETLHRSWCTQKPAPASVVMRTSEDAVESFGVQDVREIVLARR